MCKVYGYLRCSTDETKQDISRQERDIKSLVDKVDCIFKEYESGTKENREVLNILLDTVQEGDTIVCTEVSRITRSTKQLINIIQFAEDKKLKLIMGTFVLDCTGKELDPMAKAMLQMMGVFAELERNMISARVKSGMANAKAKGKIIGRPTLTIDSVPSKVKDMYKLYKNKAITKTDYARVCDVSRPTLDKYLKIIEG
ncbi:TPA: recombinase family protein [Clostridium perfringens]|uniref:recombinase family protein n=1 Tax=Clostridium perfringens TaxID=1502 RepID=UPI001CAD0336|nr:recombinase family protein [Clostridium perfringens]HBI6221945.1 recombinase family protein [Clostridium perfringens]HBI7059930.1 recombinase family protein [Clostridium perfringens]HBI7063914.1 recombinase family protein [Clostridium perfringens]HBI7066022.1 recombinase family protein [Clostridium perfringens]HBI7075042.1 recombinase family protein [Clostridium perfringens]